MSDSGLSEHTQRFSCFGKNMDENRGGRKEFILLAGYTPSLRQSEARTETETTLTGLLPVACSAGFLPRVVLPTEVWTLLYQSRIKQQQQQQKLTHRFSPGQSDKGSSLIEVSPSEVTLVCVIVKN